MGDEVNLETLQDWAERFYMEAKAIVYKLMDLAEEIEGLINNTPIIRISRKRKHVKVGDKEYYYDYYEITVENKTLYVRTTDMETIRVIERAARLRRNLAKILNIINKL